MSGSLKKHLMIFLIILTLFLSVGLVCASENITQDLTTDNLDNMEEISVEDSKDVDEISVNNDSDADEIISKDSDIDKITKDENSQIYQKNSTNNTEPTLFSTNVEYEPVVQEYLAGNTIYKVGAFEIWKAGDNKTKKPVSGQVTLKLYKSGKLYKTLNQNLDNGVSTFKMAGLPVGTYSVQIFVNGQKRATSSIKITKANTKITTSSSVVKYKKKNYFTMKVLDSSGNPAKKISLKVKVYTGKKSKTYTIKTNSKGIAKLQTKKLSVGNHKVNIKTINSNYNINKNTKINVKKASSGLKVVVESKKVLYKKSNYFNVKVTNSFGNPVKNVSLKLKVYTGKKFKKYTIKTNKKGAAKLQTSKLSLGTHKINVKAKNVNKNAKIKVVSKLNAPKLISLQYYQKANGDYAVKLMWHSENLGQYQVLKKTNGQFKVRSTVKSTTKTTAFYDDVGPNNTYSYSVREVISKNNGKVLGSYDPEGLKMLTKPKVSVDFQNLKANVTWDKVEGASKYLVYRKIGLSGDYKHIATLDSNTFSYTDVYYKSASELKSILNSETFADPSFNSLVYTVRACSLSSDNSKVSYGLYDKDGDFHLEAPSIVYLKNNQITWGKVPNAEGYVILEKIDGVWKEIARAYNHKSTTTYTMTIGKINTNAYYSVQTFSYKNGEFVYSDFDEGFTLMNYSSANSDIRILYFGDSITYGSPYKSDASRHIFSIPHRVAQILGVNFYNPSIPGSTYHDLGQIDGKNVEKTDYYRYRITREVVDPISEGELPGNWKDLDNAKNSEGNSHTSIEDYDIVVLAAGTNDYLDESELGSIDSNDTSTFNGAFNHIMGKIENASKNRVENGYAPIKVVFVDLYYSDRTYNIKVRTNRDITPNKIGLTLMDYQDALHAQYEKWSNSTDNLTFYNFKTRDYGIVDEDNSPYMASDNLHFTKYAYGQYGNAFAQFLTESVL